MTLSKNAKMNYLKNCLTLLIHKLLFVVLFVFSLLHAAPFYGDISLFTYLEQFCNKSTTKRTSLILIDNIAFDQHVNTSKVFPHNSFIKRLNCRYFYISNSNFEQISSLLQKYPVYDNRLQIIFDLTNFQFNVTSFNLVFQNISNVYSNCSICDPFIVY